MIEWWGSLALGLKFYYSIAIATSFFLIVQLLALLLGIGDGDFDADADAEGSGVLSVRTVTAFLAGFGWTGAWALESGRSIPVATLLALVAGSLLMATVVALMRGLYGLRQSGSLDYHNAVGEIGSVYLRIPPAMQGQGQVEVRVQGRLRVVQAFTRSGSEIPNRTPVRVIDIVDQTTLIVEPLEVTPPDEKKES